MIPHLNSDGYTFPEPLREVLRQDPEQDRWRGFDSAIAFAREGFRVLPVQPGAKEPIAGWGPKKATSDPERVRDVFLLHPDANVGISPDHRWVVVDVDPRHGGSLESVEGLGLPLDGYRERSGSGGWHIPYVLPNGVEAASKTIAPGIEVKAHGSMVVFPHSRLVDGGWYRVDGDSWHCPSIPASLPMLENLRPKPISTIAVGRVTQAHARQAGRILKALRKGQYGDTVKAILSGDWRRIHREWSPSEADASLVFMATYHTSDPQVLAIILDATGLVPEERKRDRAGYIALTVAKALAERDRKDTVRRDVVRSRIAAGRLLLAAAYPTHPLSKDGHNTSPSGTDGHRVNDVARNQGEGTDGAILGFLVAGGDMGDDYAGTGGWVRIPVDDVAAVCGVHRSTVWRRLKALATGGDIEYLYHPKRHDKGFQTDSWIRIDERARP